VEEELAASALRASFGWSSTMEDVYAAIASLVKLRERAAKKPRDPKNPKDQSEAA